MWSHIFRRLAGLQLVSEESLIAQARAGLRIRYTEALSALKADIINDATFFALIRTGIVEPFTVSPGDWALITGGSSMPLFRVTLFFSGGKYGWSESYYRTSNTFNDVPPLAQTLGERRRAVLTNLFKLEAIRISQEGVFRDSKVSLVSPGTGVGLWSASLLTAQQPYDALLCRFEATQLHRRQLYMRGIPVEILDPYGAYTNVPAFDNAITLFFNLLKNSPWQLRIPDPVQTPVNITALSVRAADPRFLDVTVDPAIGGAAVGQTYKVLSVSSPKGASKLWRLASVSGGGAQLGLGPNKFPLVGAWSGAGTVTGSYLYVGADITGTDVVRGVRRDTGRPFGSPVGRRRAS